MTKTFELIKWAHIFGAIDEAEYRLLRVDVYESIE